MKNTTVILVHGAFADGGGWGDVIPLLEKSGYNVIAVQNPLTSQLRAALSTPNPSRSCWWATRMAAP